MATAFEVFGEIAMFRRPYTTTSSISFPIPTPTAVAGLFAAIIGLDNGAGTKGDRAGYWQHLRGTRIAIRILAPIQWRCETINFWNFKEPQKNTHIQVKHQFISRPHYRFYVHGGVENKLLDYLREGKFMYTPYLGVAYALANIKYNGTYPWEPVCSEKAEISTLVPLPLTGNIQVDIMASGEVFRERVPFCLNEERAPLENIFVLYQRNPQQKLWLTKWEGLDVTRCGEDMVAWFPQW